jgi:hypothetical protein
MDPEECARRILHAVAHRRQEVLIGGSEVWTAYLKRWCPSALAVLVRSHPIRLRNQLLGSIPILGRRWRAPNPSD